VILPRPPVLVITDRRRAGIPLQELAGAVFAAGCRWLMLREKDLPAAERLALLENLVVLGRQYGAVVTVNSDVEAAKAAGAAGVHLPRDGDIATVRAALGSDALIGYSAHDLDETAAAAGAGADYVTLSPIFESRSKPGYGPALGLEPLREIAMRAAVPVVALGGVTPASAGACLAAGAAGVAVMGAAMRAAKPGAVFAGLMAAVDG
jgi:thiamine-phosphate pyrophosphorylase